MEYCDQRSWQDLQHRQNLKPQGEPEQPSHLAHVYISARHSSHPHSQWRHVHVLDSELKQHHLPFRFSLYLLVHLSQWPGPQHTPQSVSLTPSDPAFSLPNMTHGRLAPEVPGAAN